MGRKILAIFLLGLSAAAIAANAAGAGAASAFLAALPAHFVVPQEGVQRRLLASYGAMFVARGVELPPTVLFRSAAACARWQRSVPSRQARLNGVAIVLQPPAMQALLAAEREAEVRGLRIVPTGADASRRTYEATLRLWRSRVGPGLRYWVRRGRFSQAEARRIQALPVEEQIGAIFRLEREGDYFSLDRRKPILESVAAPGASQHLAMLALDVRDSGNPTLQEIMARHGWFQTVLTDTPHFTYLGRGAATLATLGLRPERQGGHVYWLPALSPPAVARTAVAPVHGRPRLQRP